MRDSKLTAPIRRLMEDVLLLGIYKRHDDVEQARKLLLVNTITLLAIFILLIVGSISYARGHTVVASLDLSAAALLLVCILILRRILSVSDIATVSSPRALQASQPGKLRTSPHVASARRRRRNSLASVPPPTLAISRAEPDTASDAAPRLHSSSAPAHQASPRAKQAASRGIRIKGRGSRPRRCGHP